MFGSSSILEMSRLNSLKESRLAPRQRTDTEAVKKIQLDGSVNANGCCNRANIGVTKKLKNAKSLLVYLFH